MKIKLLCGDELVNKHSDGDRYYGWSNAIDVIPPVGSTIEYMTFNQNDKEGQGVLTKYRVTGISFTTEESVNHTYINKVCNVSVEVVEGSTLDNPVLPHL